MKCSLCSAPTEYDIRRRVFLDGGMPYWHQHRCVLPPEPERNETADLWKLVRGKGQ